MAKEKVILIQIAFFVFTILLGLHLDGKTDNWSWWTVFSPLFIFDALFAFLITVTWLRMFEAIQQRLSLIPWIVGLLVVFLVELLTCLSLEGYGVTPTDMFTPLYVIYAIVAVVFCCVSASDDD